MHRYNSCPEKLGLAMPSFAGGQVRSRRIQEDGFVYECRGEMASWSIDPKKYEIRFRFRWWCVRGVGTGKDLHPRTIWTPEPNVLGRELVVCFGPLDIKLQYYYYFQRERLVSTPEKPSRKKRIKIHSSSVQTVHVFMQHDPTNITATEEGEFLPCPNHLESKLDPDDQ